VNLLNLAGASLETARLLRQQWLPADRLRALQWVRLRSMVRHAERRCPFHRERFRAAGFSAEDLRTWDDLARIPITTRDDLQEPERLLAEGYTPGRMHRSHTSGSTGKPTTTYFDRRAWTLGRQVLKLRARLACGLRPWDRVAIFQEDVPGGFFTSMAGRLASVSLHLPPAEILDDLMAFAPTAVYGAPSQLARLAEAGAELSSLRLIFTSAELLDGVTRGLLERDFGVPVLDVYGCTEAKEVAWQCRERGGYHVNAEWLVVEICDGADPGGPPEGTILITSLYNRGMPLLRYRVGDTGRSLDAGCACGRGLPLILPTDGRAVDYISLPAGGQVSPYTLTCSVETVLGLRQYQIVQEATDRVVLRVIPNGELGSEAREQLRRALSPALPNVEVGVEVVDSLPREPSGKFRVVRSDVSRPRR
jgi:phenylacetate-CoA ligase